MFWLLLISQNGDSLSFCYLQPFDTISRNHKELFLSWFCKLHSMGSHFACGLPSSIILLQRESYSMGYCSSAEPERLWKSSSLTSLMCPIKELITTFPVRTVLLYSHKHLHLSVSLKAAKDVGALEKSRRRAWRQNENKAALAAENISCLFDMPACFLTFKKGLNWNHISVPSSRSQAGWVEFADTYTHLNKQNRSLPVSLYTFLAVFPWPSLLCLAMPLQVTFNEGADRTLLVLSDISIAFSRTMFCRFKHHDSHYVKIVIH